MKQQRQILTALTLCFSSYIMLLIVAFYSMASVAQLDDPTRPADFRSVKQRPVQQVDNEVWVLSSILISPQRRIAIINGSSVRVGDTLGDVKVVKIDTTAVVIKRGNENITLSLLPKTFETQIQRRERTTGGVH